MFGSMGCGSPSFHFWWYPPQLERQVPLWFATEQRTLSSNNFQEDNELCWATTTHDRHRVPQEASQVDILDRRSMCQYCNSSNMSPATNTIVRFEDVVMHFLLISKSQVLVTTAPLGFMFQDEVQVERGRYGNLFQRRVECSNCPGFASNSTKQSQTYWKKTPHQKTIFNTKQDHRIFLFSKNGRFTSFSPFSIIRTRAARFLLQVGGAAVSAAQHRPWTSSLCGCRSTWLWGQGRWWRWSSY